MTDQPPPQVPGWAPPQKGGGHRGRNVGIGVVAVIVGLVVLGSVAGKPAAPVVAASAEPSASAAAAATSAPTVSPATPATPSETPAAVQTPSPAPVAPLVATMSFKGSGDRIVKVAVPEGLAAIAKFTSSGAGNFTVWTLDATGKETDLLVNTIGRYAGTRLFDEAAGSHSVALKVQSSGAWTVMVSDVSTARKWNPASPLSGTGDDVIAVVPPISGLATFNVRSSGAGNFTVITYTADSSDLVVNEIGKFSGQEQFADGTVLVALESDGPWTIAP